MGKIRIKVAREEKDGVVRSFVLVDDRVLDFQNKPDVNIFINTDQTYGLTVYCEGPRGAKATATLTKAEGKIIDPLTAEVDNDYGVVHASDEFEVKS